AKFVPMGHSLERVAQQWRRTSYRQLSSSDVPRSSEHVVSAAGLARSRMQPANSTHAGEAAQFPSACSQRLLNAEAHSSFSPANAWSRREIWAGSATTYLSLSIGKVHAKRKNPQELAAISAATQWRVRKRLRSNCIVDGSKVRLGEEGLRFGVLGSLGLRLFHGGGSRVSSRPRGGANAGGR